MRGWDAASLCNEADVFEADVTLAPLDAPVIAAVDLNLVCERLLRHALGLAELAHPPAEAKLLEKNNGVLYHPERGNIILLLVFKDKLDALKDLARDAKNYTVEITFSELSYQRPLAWSYFRRDAYFDADWDCQRLWEDYLREPKNAQPPHFPIALGKDDEDKIPELVRARLDSLRVLNKDGKAIGGYRAGP